MYSYVQNIYAIIAQRRDKITNKKIVVGRNRLHYTRSQLSVLFSFARIRP